VEADLVELLVKFSEKQKKIIYVNHAATLEELHAAIKKEFGTEQSFSLEYYDFVFDEVVALDNIARLPHKAKVIVKL
jgi:hypothetical protein